jgi:LmbE family N-acetylglucosaminyl deacetylase
MEPTKALEIITCLADGLDPHTGEVLPAASPYQHPDVVRALHVAIKALERQQAANRRQRDLPAKAGQPWTEEEEQRLIAGYDAGDSLQELAAKRQRTQGAIKARSVRLGEIELG